MRDVKRFNLSGIPCPVRYPVPCTVSRALYGMPCPVRYAVPCTVSRALYGTPCPVRYPVPCTVSRTLYGMPCPVRSPELNVPRSLTVGILEEVRVKEPPTHTRRHKACSWDETATVNEELLRQSFRQINE